MNGHVNKYYRRWTWCIVFKIKVCHNVFDAKINCLEYLFIDRLTGNVWIIYDYFLLTKKIVILVLIIFWIYFQNCT